MFELLLQADKSMSDGLLDQAERTYWQLIELDPTNAIAVAGLARISLQRGDQRLARTLADRALGIDPDSIAARQVIRALEEGAPAPVGLSPGDLPTKGAERLEALSRRRTAAHEVDEAAVSDGLAGGAKGAGRAKPSGRKGAGGGGATPVPGGQSQGGAKPGEREPMSSEPLRERRAGRLAAAGAAAAAAARETAHARHEPHRAMPSGRHLFQAEMLKAPPSDPFSEAEMAAAVAAVDALAEAPVVVEPEPVAAPQAEAPVVVEPEVEPELVAAPQAEAAVAESESEAAVAEPAEAPVVAIVAEPEAEAAVAEPEAEAAVAEPAEPEAEAAPTQPAEAAEQDLEHVLEAVDATEARDSVALRLSFLSGLAGSPSEPESPADAAGDRSPEPVEPAEGDETAWWNVARQARGRPFQGAEVDRTGGAGVASTDEAHAGSAAGARHVGAGENDVWTAEAGAGATAETARPTAWVSEDRRSVEASPPAAADPESTPRKKGLFRRFRSR